MGKHNSTFWIAKIVKEKKKSPGTSRTRDGILLHSKVKLKKKKNMGIPKSGLVI